ncbi:MAG: CHASE2 domain-containing protein [Archangiaceae bacterium]|nr:CHASE2 domain-containing protein [Archangiaceae bacterium]
MRGPLLAGALAIALIAAASRSDTWRGFEEQAEGTVARWRGPLPWPDALVVVAIDDASLERHGWPLPRDVLAQLVTLAGKSGARAIGFDTYLIDPTNNDEALAAAAKAWPHVVLAADCVPIASRPRSLECQRVGLPAGPLANAAALAHVNVRPSPSGRMRSVFASADTGATPLTALGVATFRAGGGEVPDTLPRVLLPHWRDAAPTVALDTVLDEATRSGLDDPSSALQKSFKDKFVLVGQSATAAKEVAPLFTGEARPLVELHAAALADLIQGRQPRELPGVVAVALIVLLGALGLLAAFLRPAFGVPLALLLGAAFCGVVWQAQHGDWVLAPLAPLASLSFAFIAAAVARAAYIDLDRERLRTAFDGTIDPGRLEGLLDAPQKFLSVSGARKHLTVLFSDVRGYAGLSNDRPADAVVQLLREYFAVMARVVTAREGRLERVAGDGLLAVFGDPFPAKDHARRAVDAALAMQEEIARLSKKWEGEGKPPVAIRIGIATGDVFIGDVSWEPERIDYTVLGPTVSLASRLEGRAPPGGVLVSAQTQAECHEHFELQSVAALALKGFQDVSAAYLAVGPRLSADPERAAPRLRAHAEVTLKAGTQTGTGTVTDVSAGGLFVNSAMVPRVGDAVEVVFGTGGILAGPSSVTVRGEVRHLRDGGFGLEVARATSGDAAAVRHFVALYLGPEALSAQVHSSGDGYQVELGKSSG